MTSNKRKLTPLEKQNEEARELLLDLRAETKRLELLIREAKTFHTERIKEEVSAGLEVYGKEIIDHIATATAAVDARFDTYARILTGEDGASERTLLEAFIEKKITAYINNNFNLLSQRAAAMSDTLRNAAKRL